MATMCVSKKRRMSFSEKLKLKTDLHRVMMKKNSLSQMVALEKLGLYSGNGSGDQGLYLTLDFDLCDDSMLWQLRTELRRLEDMKNNEEGDETTTPQTVPASNCVRKEENDEQAQKSLRAAFLKTRYAEMILKAKNGGKSDPKRVLEERERMKKRKFQEEAKMRALIKTEQLKETKMRALIKTEQLKEARKAAREALELEERKAAANIVDNFKVTRELQALMNGKTYFDENWSECLTEFLEDH